jgi:hypothetical protein
MGKISPSLPARAPLYSSSTKAGVEPQALRAALKTPARKRQRIQSPTKSFGDKQVIDLANETESPPKATPSKKAKGDIEEKRLRQYRNRAPLSYLEKLRRAKSQRQVVFLLFVFG